jgi:flagellar protein FliO/FliZ
MMLRFLLAALLALAAASAHADPVPAAASTVQAAPVQAAARPAAVPAIAQPNLAAPSAGNLVQTTFALLFVLGLLAVLAWVLKRYGPKAAGGNATVQLVGALNLGGRERIIVVEVGDQWIVVGASPGRVNALATMPKQQGVAASASLEAHPAAAPNFGAWLKQTIAKRNEQ